MGHVYGRNALRTCVGKSDRKTVPGRPKHRQEGNIILNLKKYWVTSWSGFVWLTEGPVAGSCEDSKKLLGSRKGSEFLE